MKTNNSNHKLGAAAALVLGSLGALVLMSTTALAADHDHNQWQQGGGKNEGQRPQPQQRQQGQWQQQQRQQAQRQENQRNQWQQQQHQQAQRQQNEQRQQGQWQQQQRQQAQRQENQRNQWQQQQRQQAQRQNDQRYNNNDRNNYRNNGQYNTGQRYTNANRQPQYHAARGPGWDHWHSRYYVSAPRYHWNYDRMSRPWFDYNRVSYISIYRPTYIVPAYGYGQSYDGPVGCNRDVVGAVLGGVAGGLIGAHNGGGGATLGGAVIGAILGGSLGSAIDLSDQACYGQVLEYAPSNQPVYWESDSAQYQVTPLRTYQASSGEYCREYQTNVYIDGREEQAYGTACRQPDGAWKASN